MSATCGAIRRSQTSRLSPSGHPEYPAFRFTATGPRRSEACQADAVTWARPSKCPHHECRGGLTYLPSTEPYIGPISGQDAHDENDRR
jgi:hypothetical protein